jgi:rhodanese-related sulfurtransferase
MDKRLEKNVFFNINKLNERVTELQKQINELNERLDTQSAVDRCHLLRVKNGEQLSDDYILNGRMYNDMSPEKAFDYYGQEDINYILLDVSEKDFHPISELPEATKIPFTELKIRYREIINKATPILVISENGTSSILACEFLNQMGFYNVNNVSGGYKFWIGYKKDQAYTTKSA